MVRINDIYLYKTKILIYINILAFYSFYVYSSEILDNYYIKKLIEKLLFAGSNVNDKTNLKYGDIYKIIKENKDSESVYIYFHGNAEFIDEFISPPFLSCIPNNKNVTTILYEYPGYFNSSGKYNEATMNNFISFSKKIADNIISLNKKEIYIIGWSLGVWVTLMVLNFLKDHIAKNDIKVKCVLINGFYDLYQFMDEFGGIKKTHGLLFFIYDVLIKKLIKILIGPNKNLVMSNFNLVKTILEITDFKYFQQNSIGHQAIFRNQKEKDKIKKFLSSANKKKIDILMTSALFDPITGKGMYKLYKDIKDKKF